MIRHLNETDLTEILSVWLNTNLQAHSFIPAEYWKENYDIVKQMLPQAEVYVCEDDNTGQIDGFIGITDNYIEGLFVSEAVQSKGIGKQLLNYAKDIKFSLRLSVYQKNTRAIAFYQREQFVICSERINESTNEKEFVMTWNKQRNSGMSGI